LAELTERDKTRVSRSAIITARRVDPLLDTIPEPMRRFAGIEDDPVEQLTRERLTPADGCFPRHGRLIVQGEFGSGKTNFLELLQFRAATRLSAHANPSRVPLRLNLGQWQPELQTFRIFVNEEAAKAFGNRVASDDLFLLLDEIDNRAQALDADAVEQIASWLSRHRWAWAAVAVRQVDGIAESLLKAKPNLDFILVEIERFDASGVKDFVERNSVQGEAREKVLSLVPTTENQEEGDVVWMLRSPFSLKLICALSVGRKPFPSNAALLLRAFIRIGYCTETKSRKADVGFVEFESCIAALAFQSLRELSSIQDPELPNDPGH
jgi:hypothetical protein